MKNWLTFCAQSIEKLILPYQCVMCLEISDQRRDLCEKCQRELPTSPLTCQQCGIAFPSTHAHYPLRCGQCITRPPCFDDTIVGFDYQTPIDCWLKQFKFHKKGLYARILTEIYAEKLLRIFEENPENKPQILVPMPLHWRRLTQRGFNQAYIIAQQLSRRLHIPMLKQTGVTRIKYTQAQSSLNLPERNHNMRGAFSVQSLAGLEHMAIVDDIITTGNTVNALSQQLKAAGVQRISVWAIARVN